MGHQINAAERLAIRTISTAAKRGNNYMAVITVTLTPRSHVYVRLIINRGADNASTVVVHTRPYEWQCHVEIKQWWSQYTPLPHLRSYSELCWCLPCTQMAAVNQSRISLMLDKSLLGGEDCAGAPCMEHPSRLNCTSYGDPWSTCRDVHLLCKLTSGSHHHSECELLHAYGLCTLVHDESSTSWISLSRVFSIQ